MIQIKTTYFGTKKCCVKKNVQSKMWGLKTFGFKVFFCSKTFCGQKKIVSKKFRTKNIVIKAPKLCPQSLVIIGSVTAEIFGKRTNVAR